VKSNKIYGSIFGKNLIQSQLMIKNYLTIAFRSLLRNKIYSLINISGLGLGIACSLLITLFLKEEWTFDKFHSNSKSIYRAYVKEDYGENEVFFNTVTPFPLGPALKENFQEVKSFVRINPTQSQVKVNDHQFTETVTLADPDFFNVFDFPLIAGNKHQLLQQANDIVITEETALKYFGHTDVINKVIAVEMGAVYEDFLIKAVAANTPTNSSVTFNCLISSLNYPKLYNERILTSGWFNVTPETYLLLDESVSSSKLMTKFAPVFKSILGEDFEKSKYFVGLQPITDIHLNNEFPPGIAPVNNPKYAYILAGVALLILFLACINFVTLSIGRTLKRAKEVGIRKVVGAVRYQLIIQFIGEAVLITVLSLALGVALAGMGLPVFNDLSGKLLVLQPDAFMFITGGILVVLIGLIAGSYPAFVLSEFKPISILKGKLQGNSKQTFRKILVSVQLILAVFLISSALIMRKQLSFLQDKNLGFNKDQMIVMQLSVPRVGRLTEQVASAFAKADLLKQELSKDRNILEVCAASHDFGNGDWTEVGYTDEKDVYRGFTVNIIDELYIPSMKMELVEGRNFSAQNSSDEKRAIIINEAFAKEYGWTNPIGKHIPGKNFVDHEVIGVVKDFNYASLYTKVQPLVMAMTAAIPLSGSENISINNSPIPKLFVRLSAGKIPEALQTVESAWEKVSGETPFEFAFIDETIAAQYRADLNLGKIIRIATILSILIGGLGLYALASLAIQSRVKEISIRKIMGASMQSLMVLLSRDFLILIVINILISIPLTVFFMERWLQSFEYKVSISWTIFAVAAAIGVAIGLLTISFEAVKVALSRPAEKLKNE
jgi:putative ABC transport system permease protein